jgi:hypothetical protein
MTETNLLRHYNTVTCRIDISIKNYQLLKEKYITSEHFVLGHSHEDGDWFFHLAREPISRLLAIIYTENGLMVDIFFVFEIKCYIVCFLFV